MSSKKDFYSILSLEKDATETDIKKAYRKLAVKHHPDKGGDSEKFKEISEAYEVLSDPEKKQQYDQFGTYDSSAMPNFDDIFQSFFQHNPMDDLFGGLFGGTSFFQKREQKEIKVEISLEEAYLGRTIKYRHYQKIFSSGEKCPKCKGNGNITQRVQLGPGIFSQTISPCPICRGKKTKEERKLENKKEVILDIKIPRGAPDGMQIVLQGKGDIIDDERPNDIVVTFEHKPHKKFTCSKQNPIDLIYVHELTLSEIMSGFSMHLITLDDTMLSFSKKDGFNRIEGPLVYRIKEKGLRFREKVGDLLLFLQVRVPTTIHDIYPTRTQPLQRSFSSSSILSLDNMTLESFNL